jgi:hypothetical protein
VVQASRPHHNRLDRMVIRRSSRNLQRIPPEEVDDVGRFNAPVEKSG